MIQIVVGRNENGEVPMPMRTPAAAADIKMTQSKAPCYLNPFYR